MAEIVIGFDFECAGGVPALNGFTQMGASAHLLSTGEKIAGFNEYAKMEGLEWEERCVKEFWEKNPERYAETLEKTKNAKMTCSEVVEAFIDWAKGVSKFRQCVFVSDNMIFDGGLLKYYAKRDVMYILGRYTVFYETSSVYNGMHSLRKRARLDQASGDLSSKKVALEAVRELVGDEKLEYPETEAKHDHNPENDAEAMVRKWVFIQNSLSKE